MSQIIEAIFENGVFRPQSPVELPEGARVQLDVEDKSEVQSDAAAKSRALLDFVTEIAAQSNENEDEDGSINHDHYLYGAPKRSLK